MKMKVFISWSGERSKSIALALHEWLEQLIQAADPWMSMEDIQRGKRWGHELASSLGETNFGIVCLTPENLTAPWILFEAGALAKNLDEARVCTYLLDLKPTDVQRPLADFQATLADREGTYKLVVDLNDALPTEQRLTENTLRTLFETLWPKLAKKLADAHALKKSQPPPHQRDPRELLEEILQILRAKESEAPIQVLSQTGPSLSGSLVKPKPFTLGSLEHTHSIRSAFGAC